MNNQKNRFWTFLLSLVPGAGEMYFGLYRAGVSLMLAFLLLCILPLTLDLAPLMFLAVILWFYSFLHTHNLRSMPPEEFCRLEDRCFWEGILTPDKARRPAKRNQKYQKIVAVALIVLGAYLVWQNLLSWAGWLLPGVLSGILRRMPQLVIGVLIILLGIWLISGKRKELDQEEATQASAVQPGDGDTGEEGNGDADA